ncbi:MAG TPA: DUF177 domain-containing protein [Allosphingosinicella sp.]|jgi:uncharacterized metal-binding protein YceD (DUF177 family)
MSGKPEFSRPYRIDALSGSPRRVEIGADPEEREALARRFGLISIERLSAEASLSRSGEAVTAEGRLRGAVTQSCVAMSEPVPAEVEEPFRIEFRPQQEAAGGQEEIELSEGELDVVFYEGGAIDLGEAVAETLSLSLDPYPRSPSSEEALRQAGVKSEEQAKIEASPFAALKGLGERLQR